MTRRRAKVVLAAWVVVAVLCGGVLGGKLSSVSSALTQSVDALPASSQSAQIAKLLRERFASGETYDAFLVYRRASGLTAADRGRIAADAAAVARVPHTAPPLAAFTRRAQAQLVSTKGEVAITVIPLTAAASASRDQAIVAIRKLVGGGDGGLEIRLTGPAAFQTDLNTAISRAGAGLLLATVALVLFLLVAIYRSPLIALIPLVVVGFAYATAQGLIYVYARLSGMTIDRSALTLLAVLMFGAGTDYCLLLVARYSADLRRLDDPDEAMASALSRTTGAILASGCTVAAAMLTFLFASLTADRILAPVNAIGILVVMVAGVTLLPALLTLVGRRGFWPNAAGVAAQPPAAPAGDGSAAAPGLWFRLSTRVLRRPLAALAMTVVVFGVGAVGLTSFREKISVANDFRVATDSTGGLGLLRSGFSEGAIYPETVLVRGDRGALGPADVAAVRAAIARVSGVASISQVTNRSRDGRLATLSVTYQGSPFSDAALTRAGRLRAAVASPAPGVHGLVGDGTSARLDYKNAVNHDTRTIVPVVLLLILGVLILLLRAVVAPVYLLLSVVLSFFGTLGIGVFIIRDVFGQQIDPFIPLITFVFLVALGVDYNIFLMSRVREEARTHGTRDGLLRALVATGPVITGAGLILAATFVALTTLPLWELLEIGLLVALGVLLDTFVVRTLAVPALVTLFGDRSWWPSAAGRRERVAPNAAVGEAPPHVLILGGGYVAITVCRALRRAAGDGRVRVTVVSRENFHPFHGFIGEMVTGRISASHMLSPARRIFRGAHLHVAEIERIDLQAQRVTVSRKLDGRRSELEYDQLVFGVGTRDNLEAYPGLAEHAFRLKAYEDALRLRNHILTMFELAAIEQDPEERRRVLTFFIAGGGFAGTELAGELSDYARRLTARDFPEIDAAECRVVLVEPGETILPELYKGDGSGKNAFPRLVERAIARQRRLGVEVLTETLVAAVTPTEVRLSGGQRIPTRTVISAVGMKPHAIVERLGLELDRRGRIVTDDACRVVDRPGLWAAGDCAAVPKPGGGTCPPVALYALKQGQHLGRNIIRQLDCVAARPFRWPGLGQAASVGNRYAVGELKGVQVWGLPAWLLWRGFLFRYFPSWDGRLRMLADWVIWPLVGRNMVELRPSGLSNYDITPNVFQPGEIIVRERQAGRYIHIILDGEVEICLESAAPGEALALLGPGDHFGQRWIESFDPELARSRTAVHTIAISREQAPRLQEVLGSTGLMLGDSGHFPAIPREPGSP